MTNYEKAVMLQSSNEFSMRSCWECNPVHSYLKSVGGLFTCFECDRWYMNGGFFDNEKHCDSEFKELPALKVQSIKINASQS